jgi:hypothetical protein
MWMYPRPSCPNRSISVELDDAKIDTQIQRIHALGADQNSGPSPIPLREGAISPSVSPLKPILVWLCQFLPF